MKISSLHKLSDIRSNKPGLNLLHYVAGQAEEAHPELLGLPDDLAVLEEAARTSLEVLKADIGKLDGQVTKIQAQLRNPNTKADVKKQMEEFLPVSGVLRFNNVASKLNHKIREKKPSPRGLRAENHSFTLIAIAAATLVFVMVTWANRIEGQGLVVRGIIKVSRGVGIILLLVGASGCHCPLNCKVKVQLYP